MLQKNYSSTHKAPEKNVLLISCIDLRLTDDLVRFMEHDNLTNRYDHFILAGCSLGITLIDKKDWWNEENLPCDNKFLPVTINFNSWWEVLKTHIQIAIDLHNIHDIYIVEHENCGAYKGFVKTDIYTGKGEKYCQHESAYLLAEKIKSEPSFKKSCQTPPSQKQELHIHCFRMDLRGNVDVL